jgi:hypothetical protein
MMRWYLIRCCIGLVASVALAACSSPSGDALFPLQAGQVWDYQVTTEIDGEPARREAFELRSIDTAPLDGQPTARRRSSSGAEYWLRSDETGTYRVASRSELDEAPKPDPQRRYVLKKPYAPGTQWQATTTAYLLARRSEFPREIRHTHPSIPMLYTIESVTERITTPAGQWEGCVRVKGAATVRLFADPTSGWRDLPLTTLEWYCPGVGLVRLERQEPVKSAFLSGGVVKMELQSWQGR